MKADEVPEKYVPRWIDDLDGRYAVTKQVRPRFQALTDDLGGLDSLSYQQRSLVERAIWLEYWLAKQERDLAEGKDFAVNTWVQGSNALLGLYRHLGLKRVPRSVQDLRSYMRAAAETGGCSAA